uniref:Radical S-adenosyl methionine domain-containing protein 1, mitochondrial n=1 Tax=Anthurium amnicola TaxID=1678845 RepID=A0A1D1YBF2_9ARAE
MLRTVMLSFNPLFSSFPHMSIRFPWPRTRVSLQCPPTVCRNFSAGITPTNLGLEATRPAPEALSSILLPPPTSAYVHLPFCRRRCHYCDFPIVALGSPSLPSSLKYANYDDDPRITDYIGLILREIAATRMVSGHDHPPLETIFFGGGTPSLVPPRLVSAIVDALRSKFGLCVDLEISIEMDPGTFDTERLWGLLSLGVNRVSLGVQAFQEELLRACGRAHGVREVHDAIEIVTGCNRLDNWSMDLISSLPNQTPEMWLESLKLTIDAQPTHVSVYDLQVERGTKFGQLYTPGEFPLPSESQSADLYKMASEMLRGAGYNHYEISSYCQTGFECKHNLTYWQNQSFYGFGLGSASYTNGVRFSRSRKMKEYANFVQRLEDGMEGQEFPKCVEAKDMAMDVVMLSLRMARGLDMKNFAKICGDDLAVSICSAFKPYIESGHVLALDEKKRILSPHSFQLPLDNACLTGSTVAFIRLADPDGFLLSNELISTAFGVISP